VSEFEGLQVGDQLAMLTTNHYTPSSAELVTVARLTATQVVVSREGGPSLRYYLAVGLRVGARDRSHRLVRADDPRVADAQAATLARDLRRKIDALLSVQFRTKESAAAAVAKVRALVDQWWVDLP
jgi:hypothetical protein